MTSNEDRYERSTRTHTIIYYRCNECGDTISKTQLSLRTLAHVHIPCLYNDRFTPMQVSQALPLNRHAPVEQPRMKRNARQKKKRRNIIITDKLRTNGGFYTSLHEVTKNEAVTMTTAGCGAEVDWDQRARADNAL